MARAFQSSNMSAPPGGVSLRRPSTIQVRFNRPAILVRFVSCPIKKRARSAGMSGAPEIGLPVTDCSMARRTWSSRLEA